MKNNKESLALHEVKLWASKFVKGEFSNHRPASTHRRGYKPGRKIRSMDALSRWLDAGGWVFWGDKRRAFHPGWFRSLQFNVVLQSVQAGLVRKAVRI